MFSYLLSNVGEDFFMKFGLSIFVFYVIITLMVFVLSMIAQIRAHNQNGTMGVLNMIVSFVMVLAISVLWFPIVGLKLLTSIYHNAFYGDFTNIT